MATGNFKALNVKQWKKANLMLKGTYYLHVQARVSDVDGWGFVEAFLPGRKVRTITLGPRGGLRSDITEEMN